MLGLLDSQICKYLMGFYLVTRIQPDLAEAVKYNHDQSFTTHLELVCYYNIGLCPSFKLWLIYYNY